QSADREPAPDPPGADDPRAGRWWQRTGTCAGTGRAVTRAGSRAAVGRCADLCAVHGVQHRPPAGDFGIAPRPDAAAPRLPDPRARRPDARGARHRPPPRRPVADQPGAPGPGGRNRGLRRADGQSRQRGHPARRPGAAGLHLPHVEHRRTPGPARGLRAGPGQPGFDRTLHRPARAYRSPDGDDRPLGARPARRPLRRAPPVVRSTPSARLAGLLAIALALAGCGRGAPDSAAPHPPATPDPPGPASPASPDRKATAAAGDAAGPDTGTIRFVAGGEGAGAPRGGALAEDIARGLSTDVRVLACGQGVIDGRSAFAPDWVRV